MGAARIACHQSFQTDLHQLITAQARPRVGLPDIQLTPCSCSRYLGLLVELSTVEQQAIQVRRQKQQLIERVSQAPSVVGAITRAGCDIPLLDCLERCCRPVTVMQCCAQPGLMPSCP